jgi:hypothetical protein
MLSALDLVAVVIALATSLTLLITTAIQNARLTRSRDQWRADCLSTLEKLNACEESLLRAHTREVW